MRRVSWRDVEPSDGTGAGFKKLPADGYVVVIQKVEDEASNERLSIVFDIAYGEYAGHFANDPFFADKPYTHQFKASYSQKAERIFAGFLKAVEASNPGFDPYAAADREQWKLFEGKYVGIVLREVWKTSRSTGKDQSVFSPLVQYKTTDQILDHDYKVQEPEDRRDDTNHEFGTEPPDNDVPFANTGSSYRF